MAEKKVILVTGSTGLVGQGLRWAVSQEKCENEEWIFLSSKDGDLIQRDVTEALFQKYKPTHVIHLAAQVGGLYANMRCSLDFFRNNLLMTDNILYTSHKMGVKKVISCLSMCVFPEDTSYPIYEDYLHNGLPHPSNYGYSFSKRMVDVMNKCYNMQFGKKFTAVVPCNVFGPYDNFNLEDGHVMPGMMNKAYCAQKDGTDFTIWGTGKPLRQFIYSRDLGRLLVWVLKNYDEVEPIICSVDDKDEISIAKVAELILKEFDFKGNVKYLTEKSDGQYRKQASNEKLRKLNPDFKFTPIEQAIKETVAWFRENYDIART